MYQSGGSAILRNLSQVSGTVSDVIDAFNDSSDTRTIRFYQDFDKTAATGSRIRVITIG